MSREVFAYLSAHFVLFSVSKVMSLYLSVQLQGTRTGILTPTSLNDIVNEVIYLLKLWCMSINLSWRV